MSESSAFVKAYAQGIHDGLEYAIEILREFFPNTIDDEAEALVFSEMEKRNA